MKKILTLALTLFCMTTVAQNRPTFIIQGGYQGANLTNLKEAKMVHGFRAGVAIDYAFVTSDTYQLSLQTGINYSMKGTWAKTDEPKAVKATFRLHYLDLPILLNSRFKVSETFNAFVNVGPYLAYGLSGKMTAEADGEKETAEPNLFRKYKGEKSAFYPFDFGAQVGAGIEVNRIMFGIGTQYGLTKLGREDKEDNAKNISFYLSVGYRF